MSKCTHEREVYGHWVDRPDFDQHEYDIGGFESGPEEWVPGHSVPTTRDINLHQYQCTQCGLVKNYSGGGGWLA